MRPLLIVKSGRTLPELARRRGDYEDWITAGMGLEPARIRIAHAYQDAPLPEPGGFAGVVVTGSSAMVSHREPWSERAAAWLADAVRVGTPVLGICYGHQLLAHGLGGRVARNPRGREIGTIEVVLSDAARGDPLFGELPVRLRVQSTHVEAVLELPAGARLLAASEGDPHQAFAVGERAWGVQFHPEFDADVVRSLPLGAPRSAARRGLRPGGAAPRRRRQPPRRRAPAPFRRAAARLTPRRTVRVIESALSDGGTHGDDLPRRGRRPRRALAGETIAVVGYGNQGRSQALNLRDSGLAW